MESLDATIDDIRLGKTLWMACKIYRRPLQKAEDYPEIIRFLCPV